ncbi:hypothetical protein EYC98_05330 [Halieaceae bacterium IMCC14734]|uniref:Uncharacterized protein n=1 Tax=Candidatus Litorirhabdus singularis TaxID=2518993 RepID=A0ABT3TDA8_9GAMM|nr:hypothetical protein [Candidatus Litorirhabdus singularis]MCX2980290.1 hypothetical protein [Candidatus Litorirhabdus singularis]
MIKVVAAVFTLACLSAPQALAQRQLQCEPGEECSVTCYEAGLTSAPEVFNRTNLDTLQIDLNARVLKLEFRDNPQERNQARTRSFDYFILGTDMSCTINNMHGVHD